MPLATIQALKGERFMPALRISGTNLPATRASLAQSAPAFTRPWPSRNLVPECITMSAPNFTGCCRAGEHRQLSTTSSAPPSCAMSARAWMSQTSVIGLVGVSANSSRVFGRIAAFH
jgi:hypothetical protein